MRILSIDTTHGDCSVALLNEGTIEANITQEESGKQAEQMISLIEQILEQSCLSYDDIDGIGVNIGPGSFTGVRIGLSGAKGINLVKKTPIIAVTSFESVAKQLTIENNEKDILVILDAKRKQLYTQLFSCDLTPLSEPELIIYQDIYKFLDNKNLVLTGNGCPLLKDTLSKTESSYEAVNTIAMSEAISVAHIAYDKLKNKKYSNDISPLYIRKPDAKKATSAK